MYDRAATTIQTFLRRVRLRKKQHNTTCTIAVETQNEAAQTIQNAFRCFLIRLRAKHVRSVLSCSPGNASCEEQVHEEMLYRSVQTTLFRAAAEMDDVKLLFAQFADLRTKFINRATFRKGLRCAGIQCSRKDVRSLLKIARMKLPRCSSPSLILTFDEFLDSFELRSMLNGL